MKKLSAAFGAMAFCFIAPYATAGNAEVCEKYSSKYQELVVETQKNANYNKEKLKGVQLEAIKIRGDDFKGVGQRMTARSVTLLDKTTLTPIEIKADLNGLCMSLT